MSENSTKLFTGMSEGVRLTSHADLPVDIRCGSGATPGSAYCVYSVKNGPEPTNPTLSSTQTIHWRVCLLILSIRDIPTQIAKSRPEWLKTINLFSASLPLGFFPTSGWSCSQIVMPLSSTSYFLQVVSIKTCQTRFYFLGFQFSSIYCFFDGSL